MKIEAAYLNHIALISEAHNHKIEQTLKGDHVLKNTWLCAAAHFWKQLQLVLAIDSDVGRTVRLKEIGKEIENATTSQIVIEFQKTCFPDVPVKIIGATWEYSGRTMLDIATPILQLNPGNERKYLWREVDKELLKLKTLWMIPPGDLTDN
jgi:hypothetical protein